MVTPLPDAPAEYRERRNAADTAAHHGTRQLLLHSKQTLDREAAFKRGNRHFLAKEAMKAIQWYRRAANAGHTGAQYNLGLIYLKGEGVARDALKVLEWMTKAADSGARKAQGLLQRIDRALVGE